MPLKFSNDFCTPCEPTARIWHQGNDPIRRRPIATIIVDVDLEHIKYYQRDTFGKHSTHSLSFNECVVASNKLVSAGKEVPSAHVEILKMEVQNEGKNGQRPNPGNPMTPLGEMYALIYFYIHASACVGGYLSSLLRPEAPPLSF